MEFTCENITEHVSLCPACEEFLRPKPILLKAILTKNITLVKFIIEQGADVNASYYPYGFHNALDAAIKIDDINIVKVLLSYAAEIDIVDCVGRTPLFTAISTENISICELLLQNGANPNHNLNCFTPLVYAIEMKSPALVELLLNYNANIDQPIRRTEITPLLRAIEKCQYDIIKILLGNGAKITKSGRWSTFMHALNSNLETLKILLEYGARPTRLHAQELLIIAAEKGNLKLADLLLPYFADCLNPRSTLEKAPIIAAVRGWNLQLLSRYIKNGAYVDYDNILCYAVHASCDTRILHFLMQRGAKIDVSDNLIGPIHHAILSSRLDVIKLMFDEYDYLMEDRPKLNTLMKFAISFGSFHCIKLMLRYNYTFMGRRGSEKVNIMATAKYFQESEIVNLLLLHLIKLRCLNLPVSNSDRNYLKVAGTNNEYRAFAKECLKEVRKTKHRYFHEDSYISVYHVLSRGFNEVVGFLKLNNAKRYFENPQFGHEFPVYRSFLKVRFKVAMTKRNRIDNGYTVISNRLIEVYPKLPVVCLQKILDSFSDYDLEKLIDTDIIHSKK